jgi:hypothetical protein
MDPKQVVCAAVVFTLAASTAVGQLHDYEALANWADLPLAKTGVVAGLASSYDRTGANADYNYYEWPTGRQSTTTPTTIKTILTGPGILTRFWMPHATADAAYAVKITVDGVLKINADSNVFLDGSYLGGLYGDASGKSPLITTLLGGQVSYEPIAWQHSLTIESDNHESSKHYYQYGYHLLPSGTTVTPYNGSLTDPPQKQARASVIHQIEHAGENPAGPSATAIEIPRGATAVPPHGALNLATLEGAGCIRRLNLGMGGAADPVLDALRLRVRYDESAENAIDVPVSHFFGAGHERAPYKSLPLGTDSPQGFYCYWPMPYRRGAVVELYNPTDDPIAIDSAAVEYEPGAVPDGACYLHAVFHEEITTPGQAFHELLDVAGQGHYVGNLLYVQRSGTVRDILEGDDLVIVDGATCLYGTGLEDAYNAGYYYNHVKDQNDDGDVPDPQQGILPYHGLLHMDDLDFGDGFVRTDQYRWLVGDYVPFESGLQVRVENFGAGADVLFGSTAFYYLLPEPGTMALVAGAAAWLALRRRRAR